MKLQVGRNELLSALQSVIGVVERRQTLPLLSNFLLETRDHRMSVSRPGKFNFVYRCFQKKIGKYRKGLRTFYHSDNRLQRRQQLISPHL